MGIDIPLGAIFRIKLETHMAPLLAWHNQYINTHAPFVDY